jgi:glycine reductase
VSRIVPGIGIPHPVGNPSLAPVPEKTLRRQIVLKALEAIAREPT